MTPNWVDRRRADRRATGRGRACKHDGRILDGRNTAHGGRDAAGGAAHRYPCGDPHGRGFHADRSGHTPARPVGRALAIAPAGGSPGPQGLLRPLSPDQARSAVGHRPAPGAGRRACGGILLAGHRYRREQRRRRRPVVRRVRLRRPGAVDLLQLGLPDRGHLRGGRREPGPAHLLPAAGASARRGDDRVVPAGGDVAGAARSRRRARAGTRPRDPVAAAGGGARPVARVRPRPALLGRTGLPA